VSKLFAYWITVNYREAYGMYACNGILFNHESPVRAETFVTRKITRAPVRASRSACRTALYLGNLSALRDWGHARDYVEMQWLMLQQEQPEDYVIATGVQYSVRDFVNAAAKALGLDISWRGQGLDEVGVDGQGRTIVRVDPRYFRPTEVETLLGDAGRARERLGWTPRPSFEDMVAEMVRCDLDSAQRDDLVKRSGFSAYDHQEKGRHGPQRAQSSWPGTGPCGARPLPAIAGARVRQPAAAHSHAELDLTDGPPCRRFFRSTSRNTSSWRPPRSAAIIANSTYPPTSSASIWPFSSTSSTTPIRMA
jgi:hypothetical protein